MNIFLPVTPEAFAPITACTNLPGLAHRQPDRQVAPGGIQVWFCKTHELRREEALTTDDVPLNIFGQADRPANIH
jgi:hypothetical protein